MLTARYHLHQQFARHGRLKGQYHCFAVRDTERGIGTFFITKLYNFFKINMFGGKQQYSFIWFNLITYFSLHSGRDVIILKNKEKIFCVAGKSLLTPNIKKSFSGRKVKNTGFRTVFFISAAR